MHNPLLYLNNHTCANSYACDERLKMNGFAFAGDWGVGLATKKCDMNKLPLGGDKESWVLREDGVFSHDGNMQAKLNSPVEEGDVLVS